MKLSCVVITTHAKLAQRNARTQRRDLKSLQLRGRFRMFGGLRERQWYNDVRRHGNFGGEHSYRKEEYGKFEAESLTMHATRDFIKAHVASNLSPRSVCAVLKSAKAAGDV